MADPIRCDNWDRLLFGMSLFAGEDFKALDYHPYRDEGEQEEVLTEDERRERATERQMAMVRTNPHLSPEQKRAILEKAEKLRGNRSSN